MNSKQKAYITRETNKAVKKLKEALKLNKELSSYIYDGGIDKDNEKLEELQETLSDLEEKRDDEGVNVEDDIDSLESNISDLEKKIKSNEEKHEKNSLYEEVVRFQDLYGYKYINVIEDKLTADEWEYFDREIDYPIYERDRHWDSAVKSDEVWNNDYENTQLLKSRGLFRLIDDKDEEYRQKKIKEKIEEKEEKEKELKKIDWGFSRDWESDFENKPLAKYFFDHLELVKQENDPFGEYVIRDRLSKKNYTIGDKERISKNLIDRGITPFYIKELFKRADEDEEKEEKVKSIENLYPFLDEKEKEITIKEEEVNNINQQIFKLKSERDTSPSSNDEKITLLQKKRRKWMLDILDILREVDRKMKSKSWNKIPFEYHNLSRANVESLIFTYSKLLSKKGDAITDELYNDYIESEEIRKKRKEELPKIKLETYNNLVEKLKKYEISVHDIYINTILLIHNNLHICKDKYMYENGYVLLLRKTNIFTDEKVQESYDTHVSSLYNLVYRDIKNTLEEIMNHENLDSRKLEGYQDLYNVIVTNSIEKFDVLSVQLRVKNTYDGINYDIEQFVSRIYKKISREVKVKNIIDDLVSEGMFNNNSFRNRKYYLVSDTNTVYSYSATQFLEYLQDVALNEINPSHDIINGGKKLKKRISDNERWYGGYNKDYIPYSDIYEEYGNAKEYLENFIITELKINTYNKNVFLPYRLELYNDYISRFDKVITPSSKGMLYQSVKNRLTMLGSIRKTRTHIHYYYIIDCIVKSIYNQNNTYNFKDVFSLPLSWFRALEEDINNDHIYSSLIHSAKIDLKNSIKLFVTKELSYEDAKLVKYTSTFKDLESNLENFDLYVGEVNEKTKKVIFDELSRRTSKNYDSYIVKKNVEPVQEQEPSREEISKQDLIKRLNYFNTLKKYYTTERLLDVINKIKEQIKKIDYFDNNKIK